MLHLGGMERQDKAYRSGVLCVDSMTPSPSARPALPSAALPSAEPLWWGRTVRLPAEMQATATARIWPA